MRRTAFIAMVVMATTLGVAALWWVRYAVVLFLLSLALAAALRPAVDRLRRDGWSPNMALTAVYVAAVGAILALGYVLGGELLVEIPKAAGELATAYERAASSWPKGTEFQQYLAARMPAPKALYEGLRHVEAGGVARQALSTTFGLIGVLGELFIVIMLSIYWSASRDQAERLWLSLLPVERRVRARQVWSATRAAAGAHLRGELGQSLLVSALLGCGFAAGGLSYSGIAAVAVGLLRLIPLIGLPLSVIAAALTGWVTGSTEALIAGGLTTVTLGALRLFLAARLFAAPRLNPILAVLVMLGMARQYGFAGLVIAPLIAAAIQTAFGELIASHPTAAATPTTLDSLEQRLAALQAGTLLAAASAESQSLMARALTLLARARAES